MAIELSAMQQARDDAEETVGLAQQTDVERLAQNLDEAKFVKYAEDLKAVYAWFGGPAVQIYNNRGKNVDVFNIGKAIAGEQLTVADVQKAIAEDVETRKEELRFSR